MTGNSSRGARCCGSFSIPPHLNALAPDFPGPYLQSDDDDTASTASDRPVRRAKPKPQAVSATAAAIKAAAAAGTRLPSCDVLHSGCTGFGVMWLQLACGVQCWM